MRLVSRTTSLRGRPLGLLTVPLAGPLPWYDIKLPSDFPIVPAKLAMVSEYPTRFSIYISCGRNTAALNVHALEVEAADDQI